MFTSNLNVRPSENITLHHLIISQRETEALQLIEIMSQESTTPIANDYSKSSMCYKSPPKGSILILLTASPNDINKQKKIAKCPNVFEINGNLQDPLQLASAYGLESVVQKLLSLSAEPNYRDGFGRTALFYAAQGRHNNIIKLLIDNGARTDLRDQTFSLPFNTYLMTSKHPNLFDQTILSRLQISYVDQHRLENGMLRSKTMPVNSPAYNIQIFYEAIDSLRARVDIATASFGFEFYTSRREQREPDKNAELDFSKETLIIMLKLVNSTLRLSDRCLDEVIRNQNIMMAFQFFGSLVESLAKETKSPYQDRVPWNNLAFLGCFFKEARTYQDPDFINALKLLIRNEFPIIRRELILIVNESTQWLSKNQRLTYVPPYRHLDFITLYNLTDYFHDLRSLSEILTHLTLATSLDPQTLHGRYALLQVLKKTADLAKYQHSGRNLTRTVKQMFPLFPWNEFGELRDKLAKISLCQETTDLIQNMLKNDILFFIDLKKELMLISNRLSPIYDSHRALNYLQLAIYEQNEPKNLEQAKKDMLLHYPLTPEAVSGVIQIIDEITNRKIGGLQKEIGKSESQLKGIESNTRMLPGKKTEQIKLISERIIRLREEIYHISFPYNNMRHTIFSNKFINLEQQRLLLANTDDIQAARIKKFISECSEFKCILQLESKLSMRPDRQFPELSTPEKLIIIRRTQLHFEQLLELVIPDEDKRKQLCGNSNIFEPGYDQFGGYLMQQYKRISSDPNLEYALCFIAIEVHQSLRFIGLGGNQAFRVHLEHDESIFNTISPNRLSEDINEILKFFTEDLPELKRLEEKYKVAPVII